MSSCFGNYVVGYVDCWPSFNRSVFNSSDSIKTIQVKTTIYCFSEQLMLIFLRWSLANHEYYALQHADSSNFYITEKVGQPHCLIWDLHLRKSKRD